MKNILCSLGLCLLAALVGQGNAHGQKTMGPVLELKQKAFSFGEIEEGLPAAHEFIVINSGDEPLQIDVQPG